VLYGVGARLDQDPQLLFVLRAVDESDLLARAGRDLPLTKTAPASAKVLGDIDVAAVFGLDMAEAAGPAAPASALVPAARKQSHRKAAGDRTPVAETTGKRAAAVRNETPASAARKVTVRTTRKVPVRAAPAISATKTTTSPATTGGKMVVGTTRKAPVATTTMTPVATKTAAAKASNLSRATRSRPEPKWAALARARKRRMLRVSSRSA
jgi:uncharacterized Zn finger protein